MALPDTSKLDMIRYAIGVDWDDLEVSPLLTPEDVRDLRVEVVSDDDALCQELYF